MILTLRGGPRDGEEIEFSVGQNGELPMVVVDSETSDVYYRVLYETNYYYRGAK